MSRKLQDPSNGNAAVSNSNDAPSGLFVRGIVTNRWKRMLDSGSVAVNYQIGFYVVTVYDPVDYFAVGQMVEVLVEVHLYPNKNGVTRYSLVVPSSHRPGEF